MVRQRIALLTALLLAMLSPAALFAQEPEVTIPVAVVALEGSWESPDDGETCQLVWQSAGTPTLRVTGGDGSRVRQDLESGELATIPEVADGLVCVFRVDVGIEEARRYRLSIEGAELVDVTLADLDDLAGTLVLPVATGAEGDYELATDDYLDLDLAGGDLRPAEVRPEVPSAPDEEPAAPAGTPASAAIEGRLARPEIQLFVFESLTMPAGEGCRVDVLDDDAVLLVTASTGLYRSELTLRHGGTPVSGGESPMGEAGCLFSFSLRLPAADDYTFIYQEIELARIPFTAMADRDTPYLLAVDETGNRTPQGGVPLSAPAPAAGDMQGGSLGNGQYRVVGRLDLWTSGPDDAPFGCAAGPYQTGIYPGAQVVVRDDAGAIIGYGTLSYSERSGSTVCAFDFAVTVPEAGFYTFELGNGDRVVRSFEELELWSWRVFIRTGGP